MTVYIVDSNFFIEAHRKSYPLDVALSFWLKVKELADAGRIVSIDKVKNELYDRNDSLENWCRDNLPAGFFKETDTSLCMQSYAVICNWVSSKSNHFLPHAITEFLAQDEADAFLVSYTHANIDDYILVTHEVSDPKRKNRVKIPDVCIDLNVKYLNVMDMFRALGETF